nr:hypothetical protein [Tanacetum cinerariifolium]
MDQQYPTVAKIPMLDTGKFEQWQFRMQQYLQHEHYALWEVIEFEDSYEAPENNPSTTTTSTTSSDKLGRTVTLTTEDMQKKKNDVKATKKTKKNLLKQQCGNFSAEGSKTLEQTFTRLQVIVGQLQSDLDTMSLDDLYNHLKVYEAEVQKKSEPNTHNMAFISSTKHNRGNDEVNTASVYTASSNVPIASANVTTVSTSQETACAYIASQYGKKISIQGLDVAGFDKSKVKCFNCHKMGHFARECRASRNQERGRRDTYRQGSKAKEQTPKALMEIDGVGWDSSYMANDKEDHALVAETPTEFALMANTSTENKELETLKQDKEVVDGKLTGLLSVSKDLDNLIKIQSQSKSKTYEKETSEKLPVKDAKKYKKPNKKPNVRGNQKNWNHLKSHQLGLDFVMKKKACFNCGDFNHLAYECRKRVKIGTTRSQNNTYKSPLQRPAVHRPNRSPMRSMRPNMNCACSNRTSFNKSAHSYTNRPFQRKSTVRSQYRAPWVPTVNRNFPPVNRKFSTGSRNFPTANKKFSTASRNFPTGSTKGPTADMGMKGKAVKPSACWHMTCNISYLSDFEPFDGGYVSFGQEGCKITEKGTIKTECIVLGRDFKLLDEANILLRTPRPHNMYSIDLNNIVPHRDLTCLVAKASADECYQWHRRLGHLMNKLVRHNLVRGLPTKCFENDHNCTACLKGKQHKVSCKSKLVTSVSKPLHTLHMDLFGPTSVSSISHKWSCLVVTNDFSRFTWTFFLKTKDETSGIFRKFITEIENLKDLKVKIIRCDNGGEFRNKELNDFCLQKGIKREYSNARTPQQNGVAERRNRSLIEAARTMLADVKLHVTFWAEAVNTTCYVQNRVLVNKAYNKTPYELFNGRNPAIGFLKPFGCHVMILNTLDNLGTNSTNFLGTKVDARKDVKKDVGNSNPTATSRNPPGYQLETLTVESPIPTVSSPVPTVCVTDSQEPSSETRLISKRVTNQVETPSLDNILTLTNQFEDTLGGTTNSEESNGVEADNVWTLVDCPKVVRPIGTKWVLKNKKDERGIVIRNKARLVAQGHTQEERIDYDEVFASVARIEAIRLFLAYASFMDFVVYQMEMKSVFLYGTIDEEVYVMQPPGFQDPDFPAKVYKVEKAMYGLHQAPRAWYGTLSKYLLKNGFQRGTIDQTLFIRKQREDFILVQVYVDDIIFGSSNPQLCSEFKALMHEKIQMSDMGEVNFFLGLQVLQKENGIFLLQDKYVGDILKRFRSMIGSLMYLTASRPDIMFAVCACARHQVTPKECHLYAVKRIFRYLKVHLKLGLWYPKDLPFDLASFLNSDCGG